MSATAPQIPWVIEWHWWWLPYTRSCWSSRMIVWNAHIPQKCYISEVRSAVKRNWIWCRILGLRWTLLFPVFDLNGVDVNCSADCWASRSLGFHCRTDRSSFRKFERTQRISRGNCQLPSIVSCQIPHWSWKPSTLSKLVQVKRKIDCDGVLASEIEARCVVFATTWMEGQFTRFCIRLRMELFGFARPIHGITS